MLCDAEPGGFLEYIGEEKGNCPIITHLGVTEKLD